jgi:hypothetical protein
VAVVVGVPLADEVDDEFEDADTAILKGANPGCFTQRAKCLKQYWSDEECDPAFDSNLANLNKCTWRVYDYYNYMDLDAKAGVDAINAFHPSQVKVENGTLRLSANRSPYSRSELDCKNDYFEPLSGTMEHTKKCPIFSGGIEARPFQTTQGVDGGFQQAYGRFEVRARVPFGPGAWPAFWLLPHQANIEPSSCGWPYAGEIDILETSAKSLEDRDSTALGLPPTHPNLRARAATWPHRGQSGRTERTRGKLCSARGGIPLA